MTRPSRQLAGNAPKELKFYADPDRPGKSRHRTCFPKGINPRDAGYPSTEGPCWVCERATQDRTAYLAMRSMLDSFELVASAISYASDKGFALAQELRCGSFLGYIEREKLEAAVPDLVRVFREAWKQAAVAAAYPGGRRDPILVGTAYGLLGIGYVDGRLNERDPRRYLAQLDPTISPVVNASEIEQVSGRLGCIARLIRRASGELYAKVLANHGGDEDECLRQLLETHGASSQRLAESALKFLEPSGELDDDSQERANTLAVKLRGRKLLAKTKSLTDG